MGTPPFHIHLLLLEPNYCNVRYAAIHDGVGFLGCGHSGFTPLPPGGADDHESESQLSVAYWDCSNSRLVCVPQDLTRTRS